MAIEVKETSWSSGPFPGGHWVRLDYEIGGKPYVEMTYAESALTFPAARDPILARITDLKADADTTYTITCQDGTVGTYQPGATNAQSVSLAISLTGAELTAWGTMKPKIKTYLAKCLRLYRRANTTQRAWLRTHNAVLDAVLDMIGE